MSRNNPFRMTVKRPIVVGTGLIALDIVYEIGAQSAFRTWTGGTCGNVLTILSYLGWKAFPVARLNGDAASKCVEEDLSHWGVHLDLAKTKPSARTPVVVHRITTSRSGTPVHRFSLNCPNCGSWLPSYQAVVASSAQTVIPLLQQPKVFFLDRASRGALELAKVCRARGGLVFFELAGFGDSNLIQEALELSHVVKYSEDRAESFRELARGRRVLLEIETQNSKGLRYRSKIDSKGVATWLKIPAFPVPELRDAAGAGDWCTAGIIHRLGQEGLDGLTKARRSKVEEALQFGQALAAWNCAYLGARGGMYSVASTTFRAQVERILSREELRLRRRNEPKLADSKMIGRFCPSCSANTG